METQRPLSAYVNERNIRFDRARKSVEDWLNAWIMAEHPHSPRVQKLIDLYEYIAMDDHLSGAIENRKLAVLGEKFVLIGRSGEPDGESTELLRKSWFRRLMKLAMDSLFYGHSLIEISDLDDKGEISSVKLIERRNVLPGKRLVLRSPGDITGLPFDDPSYADWYVTVGGEDKELGLLLKAAVNVIYKRYAKAAWVEHAEVFNLPFLHGKTDLEDSARKQRMVESISSAGRERTAITGLDDEIASIPMSGSDAYNIYKELETSCNQGNSKLILGQTMTMDSGSSRSQGEVHERVADAISQSDRGMIESLMNEQVLPKLTRLGYPFEGLAFKFDTVKEASTDEKVKVYTLLLEHYEVSEETIQETFGVQVTRKPQPVMEGAATGSPDQETL